MYIVIGGLARVLRGADETTTGVDIVQAQPPTTLVAWPGVLPSYGRPNRRIRPSGD